MGTTIGQMIESLAFVSQLKSRGFEIGADYALLGSPDRIYSLSANQRALTISSFVKAFQATMFVFSCIVTFVFCLFVVFD